MKKYKVEITEAVNTYCYTGEWDSDFLPEGYVEAESEEEAIEFAKDYLNDNGVNADDYIFRINQYITDMLNPPTIKELRAACGMTQKAFAEFIGTSKRNVENWEGGKCNPPEGMAELIEYKLKHEGLI